AFLRWPEWENLTAMKTLFRCLSTIVACTSLVSVAADSSWQPANGPLKTRWAKDVKPDKVLPEYPRPQMVRKEWQNLNGLWNYAITDKDAKVATQWQGRILVPFPIQSALSGAMTN